MLPRTAGCHRQSASRPAHELLQLWTSQSELDRTPRRCLAVRQVTESHCFPATPHPLHCHKSSLAPCTCIRNVLLYHIHDLGRSAFIPSDSSGNLFLADAQVYGHLISMKARACSHTFRVETSRVTAYLQNCMCKVTRLQQTTSQAQYIPRDEVQASKPP